MPRSAVTLVQRLEALSKENAMPDNPGKLLPGNGKTDYYAKYVDFAGYLKTHIHPHVTQVAMLKDGGYLTNHGPEHITTVIQRASDLLDVENRSDLSGYEIFLLLCAIQIHDAGHIKGGRQQHEKNGKDLLVYLTADSVEKSFINDIAKVHGGVLADGERDTIDSIEIETLYHGFNIRLQFLAAVLRFADELSDDESRASNYLLLHGGLPESSEVYHAYADALKSVTVVGRDVRLNFIIPATHAVRTYGKGTGKKNRKGELIAKPVYLLDEILDRTFKMYCECVYCMRFFPLAIQLRTVNVEIKVYDYAEYKPVGKTISYKLTEKGYPSGQGSSATKMCKEELTIDGKELNGEYLKEIIERTLAPAQS